MRPVFCALISMLAAFPAAAAPDRGNVYLEAAAVTERCGGERLTDPEVAALDRFVRNRTGGAADISDRLERARAAVASVDCNAPLSRLDIQLFTHFVRPNLQPSSVTPEENAQVAEK